MCKNFISGMLLGAVGVFSLASCDKSDGEPIPPGGEIPTVSHGVYVLNQGNLEAGVEGSFNIINYDSDETLLNVFSEVNRRSIGDTPQCGIAYGSKIYIGVFESKTIEIIDRKDYKSIKQLALSEATSTGTQPRSMLAKGGKIYISMFDGYVARLDTTTLTIDASVKTGPNPETMALYRGKIYVPNSDGMNWPTYGQSASVIDPESFTVTKTFEVPENPSHFYANENGLFLLCMGNYNDVQAKIYKLNDNLECTAIDNATVAELCEDFIYYVNDPFYGTGYADYKKFNIKTGEISDWEIEKPEYAENIYYDSVAKKILISSLRYYGGIWPSYQLPGYVAVYDKEGNHLRNYQTGVGPAAIFKNAE